MNESGKQASNKLELVTKEAGQFFDAWNGVLFMKVLPYKNEFNSIPNGNSRSPMSN